MIGKTNNVQATGITSYRGADFARVRALMSDADKLPETYEKFLYGAQKLEQQLRRSGVAVIRVHLDEHDFPAYCARKGLSLNAQARMEYASFKAAEVVRQGNARGGA